MAQSSALLPDNSDMVNRGGPEGLSEPVVREIRRLLRDELNELFNERARIDEATHFQDHQWIRSQVAREAREAERWEKIKAQLGGWGIIALLTAAGSILWDWLRRHLS